MVNEVLVPEFGLSEDRLEEMYDRDDFLNLMEVNRQLKKLGTPQKRREWGRKLLRRMWPDQEEWVQKTHFIQDKKGRMVLLRWNYAQRKLHRILTELKEAGEPIKVIILKARQHGFSTFIVSWQYDMIDRYPNRNAMTISYDDWSTKELMFKARTVHEQGYFSRNVTRIGTSRLAFTRPHNSAFLSMTAGNKSAGRSVTINHMHYCLAPSTPVITADGRLVRAEDVEAGDKVITHNGHEANVTAVVASVPSEKTGSGRSVRITPWLGKEIELTPNHPVFTQRGWVQAGELSLTDKVSMPIRKITDDIETVVLPKTPPRPQGGGTVSVGSGAIVKLDREFGFAVGYYLAEGSIDGYQGRENRVTFSRHRDEAHYTDRACKGLEGLYSGRTVKDYRDSLTTAERLNAASLAMFLSAEFGRSSEKRIPDWVFKAGKEFCTGVVSGYLCGDGSKTHGDQVLVQATTICSSLATQIRDLVLSLGIGWSSISHKKAGVHYGRRCQEAWTNSWSGSTARELRVLMGLEQETQSKHYHEKLEVVGDKAWFKIRSIKEGSVDLVYDISVDHDDHSFRTLYFSVKNSEIPMWAEPEETLTSANQCVPGNDPHASVIHESTAKGMHGVFYRMWKEAGRHENDFQQFFAPWMWADEYQTPFQSADHRNKFMRELPHDHREVAERLKLTPEQSQWRYRQIRNELQNSVDLFKQEYPSVPEEAFLSTGSPAFDRKSIESLSHGCQPPQWVGNIFLTRSA